jgi:uncharacterized membrane protein YgcG
MQQQERSMVSRRIRAVAWSAAVALAVPAPLPAAAQAASTPPPPPTASTASAAPAAAPFRQEEIEQLVAPIALYPDRLLAQVLMASTYPLEVVLAARWVKANPKVSGAALETAMHSQKWDPAVKSLTAVPQVLEMMEQKVDWTQKLGDAFLGQEADVMKAVQRLRAKASAAGNLKSGKEQTVTTKTEGGETTIVIEPATEVVYVPTYDPSYVYGYWPYPAYPPYYWYPPGYYYPGGAFLAGVVIGAWLWGGMTWGGNDPSIDGGRVRVDHHRYNDFNRSSISDGNWRHNVEHRQGVAYRDQATAKRFDRDFSGDAASREAFRGRADAGARGDGGGRLDSSGVANRGAFDGVGNSAATRDISSRGNASRASMGGSIGGRGGGFGGGGRGGGRR